MPIPTLDQVRALPNPAPNWRWVANMPTLSNSGGTVITVPQPIYSIPGISRVEMVTLPHRKLNMDQRFVQAWTMSYPKQGEIDVLTMNFYEDENHTVGRYLATWFNLIQDDQGNYGMRRDYAKNIIVEMYGWSDNTSPRLTIQCDNCWLMDRTSYELTFGESNKIMVSAVFACEDAKIV